MNKAENQKLKGPEMEPPSPSQETMDQRFQTGLFRRSSVETPWQEPVTATRTIESPLALDVPVF